MYNGRKQKNRGMVSRQTGHISIPLNNSDAKLGGGSTAFRLVSQDCDN